MTATEQTIEEATVDATVALEEIKAALAAVEQARTNPTVQDPYHAVVGHKLTDTENAALIEARRRTGNCGQRCAGAPGRLGGYGYCVREPHGPELPHFVVDDRNTVTWTWTNGEELVDVPTDTTVVDPDDAKVETFLSGMRVNKRNSRDVLMVLSTPKKRDERIEILDLTHQRFRKIARGELVPVRDDDPEPTPEQMKWVAEFIADRRKAAYDIAAREVGNRRWDRPTMLASVRKIGIAEPPIEYGTSISLSLTLKVPGRDAQLDNTDALKAAVEAAIKVAAQNTLPEGFEVRGVREFSANGITELR